MPPTAPDQDGFWQGDPHGEGLTEADLPWPDDDDPYSLLPDYLRDAEDSRIARWEDFSNA